VVGEVLRRRRIRIRNARQRVDSPMIGHKCVTT
jgi:hypothetical protein